jgi:hypothetical protein
VTNPEWGDPNPGDNADHAVIAAQHPDAVILTVTPGVGGTLVYTDGNGSTTTVLVPPGAVSETLTLIFTPLPKPSHATAPLAFAGHAFLLEAYKGPYVQPGYVFEEPLLITIHYSDDDIAGVDDEAELRLYVWTGREWNDAACRAYTRQLDENWLSAEICHLSEFALLGEGQLVPVGGETLALPPLESLWGRFLVLVVVMVATLAACPLLHSRKRPRSQSECGEGRGAAEDARGGGEGQE